MHQHQHQHYGLNANKLESMPSYNIENDVLINLIAPESNYMLCCIQSRSIENDSHQDKFKFAICGMNE
ncbi:hypothetical protein BLOT_009941 [Blomia tropicalis]|nr:hypothetical protein BLOT_009941 [Blomia tropicalis]